MNRKPFVVFAVIATQFVTASIAASGEGNVADEPMSCWLINGTNGVRLNTNVAAFWNGIWKEDTNGWRVQLSFSKTNSPDITCNISVGSVKKNLSGGFFRTPARKFAIFELSDKQSNLFPLKKEAPSEKDFPKEIRISLYARYPDGTINDGGDFGSRSNGPPSALGEIALKDIYSIKTEGDYILTVCPVVYARGTNDEFFERKDLPCVIAKVHLFPIEK